MGEGGTAILAVALGIADWVRIAILCPVFSIDNPCRGFDNPAMTRPWPDLPAATSRDRLPLAALVVANLIPLVGVIGFGWRVYDLVLVYWLENLVIGFWGILKILTASAPEGAGGSWIGRVFLSLFFCVHYGGFCAVHGVFLLTFFGRGEADSLMSNPTWFGPLIFVELLVSVVRAVWEGSPRESGMVVAALMMSHGASFVMNYLLGGERAAMTSKQAMAAPYVRIVIMHVTVLVGGALIALAGSPLAMLALLVVMKTAVDVHFHRRERRRFAAPQSPAGEGAS